MNLDNDGIENIFVIDIEVNFIMIILFEINFN